MRAHLDRFNFVGLVLHWRQWIECETGLKVLSDWHKILGQFVHQEWFEASINLENAAVLKDEWEIIVDW